MTHSDGTYFFVGRPRRFGKTLLVSTMQSYFEGKKDLFKGLAMEQLEKEWIEYPVIHLDMSGGKYMSEDQLQRYLIDLVEEQERKFSFHNEKIDINLRLKDLIMSLYQTTGKKVVVLIDEYDAPLLDMAHEKEELVKLRNIMRKYHVLPTSITRVEADESEFDAPTENMTTMMPLLYQSGYLTIKDYNYYFHHLLAPHRLSGRCRGAYSKGKGRCRFVDWNRFIHHRTETR